MILFDEILNMTLSRATNTIKRLALQRIPKFVSIFVVTGVVVSSAGFVASASVNSHRLALHGAGTYVESASGVVSGDSRYNFRHHGPSSTTTTLPQVTSTTVAAPTTTQPAPTTTQPAPTTTQPAPTTTQPAPTTTQPAPTTTQPAPTTTVPAPSTPYPVGMVDSSQPSGYGPPSANALAGFTQGYVTDFPGNSLPSGWIAYSGKPGGDPGGQFGSAHAVVGNGMLSLNTFQDPAYGNEWVTGGVCECGVAPTYAAFFVRSRVTGPGPTNVELLWPQSNNWPPEIDFNETYGTTNATTGTVHWGATNSQYHSYLDNVNMTLWHTWGVIWTPTSLTYTVDGRAWASVTGSAAQFPNVPMHLALQQQTWCGASPVWACPSAPQSMQINWVAEYSAN